MIKTGMFDVTVSLRILLPDNIAMVIFIHKNELKLKHKLDVSVPHSNAYYLTDNSQSQPRHRDEAQFSNLKMWMNSRYRLATVAFDTNPVTKCKLYL